MLKNHPWETLSYQQVIDTPYLKIRCEQVAVPNGPVIPDYYIIENRGWVGIVPLTEDGHFLINNQYKHGIGSEVLEFPAGGIDSHEDDPVITARRELMEETGPKEDPVEVIENLLVTPRELLELIHNGSFAVQGQIAAAYMALERLGYITMTL